MTTTFSEPFLRVAEHHAARGAEQLEALGLVLPDAPWTADLERGVYESGGLTLRVGLLGTFDPAARSWLWGWANPGFAGTPVTAASARLAEFGRAYGVPELAEPGVDLSGFADPRHAAEALAFTGMGVLGAPGYIGQEAGPETRVYFVPQDPALRPAPLDPVTVPRMLLTGAGLFGHDARAVVRGYFGHHGASVTEDADAITALLPNRHTVRVSFDPQGRIASVDGTLGGN
ncbi:hypothetical protein HUT16_16255 [Kitasatospora sp. NA04385]|uniref:DUF6882 domain-containing protein n=1 Tax=Kitasatospora sp. NA04385 TaxID=2742135 RepID=UPI0015921FDE|nr:DUF6882 domain-containing protein [Kitasatospora sp. NA04385]QKW20413.1 hypothetical protein HUT16_16255 [Kitasatospora sp. NA04385]